MCCGKKDQDGGMSPMQLKQMKESKARSLEERVKRTEEKMNNGQPLGGMDICPYCKSKLWYWCKKGCILQQDLEEI